jgi:hypothetical protein
VKTFLYTVPETQSPNAIFIGYIMMFHVVNKEMTNELVGTTASQADEEKNPLPLPKIKPWYC